jgi:outer membrane scaffolding protein for murein synthesis (MipA/OmpV family)
MGSRRGKHPAKNEKKGAAMRQFRLTVLISTCLFFAGLPSVLVAQSDADPGAENEAWASTVTAQGLQDAAVAVAMAEGSDSEAGTGDADEATTSSQQQRADKRVESGKDVGVWGDLDDAVPFDLLSFNIGLKLSVQQRPYKGVDADLIVFPVISRFTDLDFTDQIAFCREGNCGLRYARNWYEIGAKGRWNALGYSRDDSPSLAGMIPRDSSIEMGPYVGLRSDHVQARLMYFQDVMANSDGSELRLVFDFPIRLENGYIVPHIDFYSQNSKYTNYYYGIDPAAGDRFEPGCAYPPNFPASQTCQSYTIRDDADNIDLAFRSQFQIGKRWFMQVNGRIAFLDDIITGSPIVDSSPDRWWFGVGFTYKIDPSR